MSMEISGPFSEVERGSEKAADFVFAGGKNVLTGLPGEGGEVWSMNAKDRTRNRVTEKPVPSDPEILFTYDTPGYAWQPVEDGSGLAYAYMAEGGPVCVDIANLEVVYDEPRPTDSEGNSFNTGIAGTIQDGVWYTANNWYYTVPEMAVLNPEDGTLNQWWHNSDITYSYATPGVFVDGMYIYETQTTDYNAKAVAVDPSDGSIQWELLPSDGFRSGGYASMSWVHDPNSGLVLTSNYTGGVIKIDPSDGSMVGTTEETREFDQFCINDGIAYGLYSNTLAAMDIEAEEVIWSIDPNADGTSGEPTYYDGTLYCAVRGWDQGADCVIALDATDGSVIWKRDVLDFGTWTGAPAMYSIADDVVISPVDDAGMLYALDGSDGSTIWSLQVNGVRGNCIPMDGKLVTACSNFDVIGDP